MARETYDTTKPFGIILAESIDHLIKARQGLDRWRTAEEIATNAGTTNAAIEGGDFGVPAGRGDAVRTLVISITDLLTTADGGGLKTFTASLDVGG